MLERIIANKRQEVSHNKALRSATYFKDRLSSLPPTVSFIDTFEQPGISLIAEIKKGSPSKGIIRADFNPVEIAEIYASSGARAISVLTDEMFFHGNAMFLQEVRQIVTLPLLRKDFIIDSWQVYESRFLGADFILLIAAVLSDDALTDLLGLADSLGLECLVEIHNEEELERVRNLPNNLIGINNRDLRTFQTDLRTTLRLAERLQGSGRKIVSESGINTRADVELLSRYGIDGILVGEALMRERDIGRKVKSLLGPGNCSSIGGGRND